MFEVQLWVGNGWENCWSVDDRPAVFANREEAEQAIEEHLKDAAEAVEEGFLEDFDDRKHFRVVPVGGDNVR